MAQKNKKVIVEKESSSEIVRKFKANPALFIGTVVVLVLVIVSFILVPAIVPESTRGGGDLTFGYYDKTPISWVPGNYFAQYQSQFEQYYRGSIDTSNIWAYAQYIWRPAFEAAAVHVAVLQEMKKSNYTVPVKTVDREVAKLPQFQDNGRFSSALYNQMSDSSRLVLWRQIQDELTKMQYFNDLFGMLVPSGEAEFISGMASDMRTFDGVIFNVDDFPESEYLAFAEGNPDLFDSIHLSRISVNSSEREAKKILESIKNGTSTFEDAARSQSRDDFADRGGDMGIRYVFELEREIPNAGDREKLTSLNKEELSDVIKIEDVWVFFRVEDDLKKADFNDAAVIDRVRSYMRNFQRGRMEDWAIAQAEDFNTEAEASGFSDTVRRHFKEKFNFGPLPVNYGSSDLFTTLDSFSISGLSRQELTDLSKNENFWKTAFSTPLNTPSSPLVQGSKVLVFFPVEQIKEDEDKIKEIEANYAIGWVNNRIEQSLIPFFINNSKFDDRFWETFYRIFAPAGS